MDNQVTVRKAWRLFILNALLSSACLVYYFFGSPGAGWRGVIITYFISTCGTVFLALFHPKLQDKAFRHKMKVLLMLCCAGFVGWCYWPWHSLNECKLSRNNIIC